MPGETKTTNDDDWTLMIHFWKINCVGVNINKNWNNIKEVLKNLFEQRWFNKILLQIMWVLPLTL